MPYMAVVPALLLQIVITVGQVWLHSQLHYMTMPSSQYTFSKKDPSQNHKLKHPFVDDSPTAKLTVSSQEQTYTSQLVRTPLATGFIL
ncbi:hypothetical protein CY35_09G045000 [Sphagnum magellanicum]|nr:hypothetical protein CY35_09G045000 [Sphagnum magellanicum]KAH9552078.1 hypothetical protein CY35_09G045000 [Sphagnum magellanicum]KAH9552079.1 hypothetical protein CY35_09G045000 [Sphagnum magellanicum]KAH9552080.1 hypothetical protein CY35_09G045000 [Sphagnum magellanicum]